jgi:hypothetical protein
VAPITFTDENGGDLEFLDVIRFSNVIPDDSEYLLISPTGASGPVLRGTPFRLDDALRGFCLSALDDGAFTLGACSSAIESDSFTYSLP